ncbi:uncharacterized protein BYT42DRAFT_487345, partial [Radiomyces spectabilis]|uniref:uncharacterized protein n=1 Tax=Radiomyces spectabilis TaxID=64574 RepID=UPI00221E3B63
MKLENKLHELDCIALDGGYTLFLNSIINESNTLTWKNFIVPIRKEKNKELSDIEKNYNNIFGGFRSKIETIFANL